MLVTEALELISTAANHSNAAIRKMVRLCSTLYFALQGFFCFVLLLFSTPFRCLIELYKNQLTCYPIEELLMLMTVSQQHCKSEGVNKLYRQEVAVSCLGFLQLEEA